MNDLSFIDLPERNPRPLAALFLNELSFSVPIFSMHPENLSNTFLADAANGRQNGREGGRGRQTGARLESGFHATQTPPGRTVPGETLKNVTRPPGAFPSAAPNAGAGLAGAGELILASP